MLKYVKQIVILFLLLGGLFCFTNPTQAKEIKIIQVTDSHISTMGQGYSERDVSPSLAIFKNTIKDINRISDVDFVVFCGDNIDKANSTDLEVFLKEANKLHVPYYVVIGNHEVFKSQKLLKTDYMKIVRKYSKSCNSRKPNYVFKKKGMVFIVLDGAKEIIPGPAGYFRQSTLKWFSKQLKKYKNKDVVVFQHFPIEPPYFNRSHSTYNVQQYKDVIKGHDNIVAIVSGHYHANGEVMKDGIYHISTPSLLEAPHYYKVIEIETKYNEKPQVYTMLRHAQ